MDTHQILGDGPLGRAIDDRRRASAATEPSASSADPADRPARPDDLARRPDVVVDASRGDAVGANVAAALDAGCRRFVIATTGWEAARADVDAMLREHGAAAVAAANFSLGVVLFGRLVEAAVELFGPLEAFDPYLVEWHRRSKRDRPSGTGRPTSPRRHRGRAPAARRRRTSSRSCRPGGRIARDAPRRLRRRGRDGRAAPDAPATAPPTRPGSSPPPTGCAARRASPASTPSTRSSTSSIARRPHAACLKGPNR